ncbi:MAG: gliding motility-associated C-terminal domain-containing protein [Saprospiraceae bacterium]|nr:gliding motility-associated C-terminal domain-containing protein [Saprospiraceae bacterium]
MRIFGWTLLLFLFFGPPLRGQQPFVCKGDYYLTLQNPNLFYNELFSIDINPLTQRVTFQNLNIDPGYDLNAMGYRSTDNFIYVLDQKDNGLVRIGADGRLVKLRKLDEIRKLRYFAGACTPDGKYLVISGSPLDFGFGSANVNLVFIDLEDPDYGTREVNMRDNPFLFFDMDFDPLTGICYAYDFNYQTLLKIDIERGTTSAVGRAGQPCTSMGTLFFDAFGNLYGYGRPEGENLQNTLFQINTVTGDLTIRTTGENADRSDGCSCPYTIKLEKDVVPRRTAPCGEVVYTFTIANASALEREGIQFFDPMPPGFEILEVLRNPFGGTIVDTGSPNELLINDMTIPLGIDSILVRVRIGDQASGIYENQASLQNLPESLGDFTLSDDPTTVVLDDPTKLQVIPLQVDLQSQNRLVCVGDSLILSGSQEGADYLWQDGSTGMSYKVSKPGVYWVRASTICEEVSDTIVVEYAPPLSIELGEDFEANLGDSFVLAPNIIIGTSPYQYSWNEAGEVNTISCHDCPSTTVTPFFDTRYQVTVTDGAGCQAQDFVDVKVDRNVYVWIPNAFSPNGDGINDYFYMQGQYNYNIESFEIYNRWGERLFVNENIQVDDEVAGWNGRAGLQMMTPDVYVYRIVLSFIDGSKQYFSGDVTLIR